MHKFKTLSIAVIVIVGLGLGAVFLISSNCNTKTLLRDHNLIQVQPTTLIAHELGLAHKGESRSASVGETSQITEQMLSQIPLDKLRRAYYKRMEVIEKQSIESRFKTPETPEERKVYREALFNVLQETLERSSYWQAKSSVTIEGKSIPVTMILSYYDATQTSKDSLVKDIKESKNLCWLLQTYFGNEPTDNQWISSSACLETISKTDSGDYYIVQMISVDSIESHLSHLAVPIPLLGSDGIWEVLETKTQQWRKSSRLEWMAISSVEAEQIQKEHKKTEE